MGEKRFRILQTPIGALVVGADEGGITDLRIYRGEKLPDSPPSAAAAESLNRCQCQLEEYFKGMRRGFDLPLHEEGTPFQKKVWEELRRIPYGETRSYGQVAAAIGNPKAFRAVGMANNKNPIMIITPCHRVIGGNGALVGYAGGLNIKRYLLEIEGMKNAFWEKEEKKYCTD